MGGGGRLNLHSLSSFGFFLFYFVLVLAFFFDVFFSYSPSSRGLTVARYTSIDPVLFVLAHVMFVLTLVHARPDSCDVHSDLVFMKILVMIVLLVHVMIVLTRVMFVLTQVMFVLSYVMVVLTRVMFVLFLCHGRSHQCHDRSRPCHVHVVFPSPVSRSPYSAIPGQGAREHEMTTIATVAVIPHPLFSIVPSIDVYIAPLFFYFSSRS